MSNEPHYIDTFSIHLNTETDPVSKVLYIFFIQTIVNGQREYSYDDDL